MWVILMIEPSKASTMGNQLLDGHVESVKVLCYITHQFESIIVFNLQSRSKVERALTKVEVGNNLQSKMSM